MQKLELSEKYFIIADSRQFILCEVASGETDGYRCAAFAQTFSAILKCAVDRQIRLAPETEKLEKSIQRIYNEIDSILLPLRSGNDVASLFMVKESAADDELSDLFR